MTIKDKQETIKEVNEHGTYKTKLHFRFEGDRDAGIESIDVAVPRLVLEAFPDTVLATLAKDAWVCDENAGEIPDKPLITKPLAGPCQDQWSPSLVTMIKEAYLWKYYEKNEDKIRMGVLPNLPPKVCMAHGAPLPSLPPDAKIQDALAVLDYYGLAVDPNVIDLDQLSDAEQIKTGVFIRDLGLMELAVSFVIDTLKQKPQHETLFLFAKESADMAFINHKNSFAGRPISPNKFVRMGEESDCQGHFEWSHREHQRRIFLEQLQDKLPQFPVSYLSMCFSHAHQTEKPAKDFSFVETRDLQDGSIAVREMVVLSVTVPGMI